MLKRHIGKKDIVTIVQDMLKRHIGMKDIVTII